jgi:hypothetical protein
MEVESERGIVPKSLMKSILQKAVRQNKADVAVKAAKHIIQADEADFCRRLPVVILEDSILHPQFGFVGKMQKEIRKSNPLTEEQKDQLINIVWQMAASEKRDIWIDEGPNQLYHEEEKEAVENKEKYLARINELDDDYRILLDAIKLRATSGGMGGDVVMCWNFYYVWLRRSVEREWTIEKMESIFPPSPNLKYKDVEKLTKEEIPINAVDFHISPMINVLLKKEHVVALCNAQFPNKTPFKTLQDVLWRQWSSPNKKLQIDDGKTRDWYNKGSVTEEDRAKDSLIMEEIRSDVEGIANWWIKKQMEAAREGKV